MSESGALLSVLEDGRRLGFLGPGPLETHLDSAQRFRAALDRQSPRLVLDLGSGGGVPALPLALWLNDAAFVLVDSMERRTVFLAEAVERLGLAARVRVVRERAEVVGRDPDLRGRCDAVTARSFGAPAVTAECGAPLLRVGGVLVVSEPPDRPARWPDDGLEPLGLSVEDRGLSGVAVLRQTSECPDKYPRRSGIPGKRPLF